MTDLDVQQRLRADAARRPDLVPPALHDALDAVLDTERTARRRHAPLLAAAAAAVVVAGAASALAVWRGGPGSGSDPDAATGPQPQATAPLVYPSGIPRTRGNERLFKVAGLPVGGVLYDPAHPRTLGILVQRSSEPGGCSVYGAEVGVVERSGEVQIQLSGWQYLQTSKGNGGYKAYTCSSDKVVEITVTLHDPLGNRPVVNDGQPDVPVLRTDAGTYPTAHYLPAGYAAATQVPPGVSTHLPTRTYVNGAARLVIRTAAQPGDLDKGTSRGHTKVGTETATVTGTATEACVTWPAPAGLRRQVCSSGTKLTVYELVKVAEGLR